MATIYESYFHVQSGATQVLTLVIQDETGWYEGIELIMENESLTVQLDASFDGNAGRRDPGHLPLKSDENVYYQLSVTDDYTFTVSEMEVDGDSSQRIASVALDTYNQKIRDEKPRLKEDSFQLNLSGADAVDKHGKLLEQQTTAEETSPAADESTADSTEASSADETSADSAGAEESSDSVADESTVADTESSVAEIIGGDADSQLESSVGVDSKPIGKQDDDETDVVTLILLILIAVVALAIVGVLVKMYLEKRKENESGGPVSRTFDSSSKSDYDKALEAYGQQYGGGRMRSAPSGSTKTEKKSQRHQTMEDTPQRGGRADGMSQKNRRAEETPRHREKPVQSSTGDSDFDQAFAQLKNGTNQIQQGGFAPNPQANAYYDNSQANGYGNQPQAQNDSASQQATAYTDHSQPAAYTPPPPPQPQAPPVPQALRWEELVNKINNSDSSQAGSFRYFQESRGFDGNYEVVPVTDGGKGMLIMVGEANGLLYLVLSPHKFDTDDPFWDSGTNVINRFFSGADDQKGRIQTITPAVFKRVGISEEKYAVETKGMIVQKD